MNLGSSSMSIHRNHPQTQNALKQHHRRQSSFSRRVGSSQTATEDIYYDDDDETGVFHVRFNGVCTFTPFDAQLDRDPMARLRLSHEIKSNRIPGRRINRSHYTDGMTTAQKVACWIQLDEYLTLCLVDVHGLREINIFENTADSEYDDDRRSNPSEDAKVKLKHLSDHDLNLKCFLFQAFCHINCGFFLRLCHQEMRQETDIYRVGYNHSL